MSPQEQVQEHLIHLKDLVTSELQADQEFFLSGIDRYSLTIVGDADNDNKDEPDFGTVLPLSFYQQDIKTAQDIVVHYLHVMGHKKCMEFWLKHPYPRDKFTYDEIHFMEEIYNQRLFLAVAPNQHKRFFDCFTAYDRIRSFKYQDFRDILNSLLQTKSCGVPKYLQHIHERLYASDPLLQSTFSCFVGAFEVALHKTSFRDVVKHYDTRKENGC